MEATIIIKDRYPFEDDEKTFIFHMIGGHSSIQIETVKKVVDSTLKYFTTYNGLQESVDIHIGDTWLKELTTADIDELINTLVMLREDKLAKLGGTSNELAQNI